MAKKEKKRRKMPKGLKITLLSVLCVIVAAIVGVFAYWAIGSNDDIEYIETLSPIGDNGLTHYIDEDTGYWCFVKNDGEDFKLLRLSDTHLGAGPLSVENDKKAIDTIYALAEQNKPDLIVVSGDMIFPVPYISGTNNNYHQIKTFIELMEQLEIPWTVTFGNHDTEIYSYANRKALSKFISEYETQYCVYQPGPEDIRGYGNTMIQVENSDGSVNMIYVLIDSNAYVDGSILFDYDSIHIDQVEWYKEQLGTLADKYTGGSSEKLPSIAIWHIACKEYQYAYDLYKSGSSEVEWLDIGENDELEEYVSEPAYAENDTIFDAMKELGSTKISFVGHDHYNSFGVKYEGIYLCYGLAVDYLGYTVWDPDFASKTDFRGGTLISTDDSSSVVILQDRYLGTDSELALEGLWS